MRNARRGQAFSPSGPCECAGCPIWTSGRSGGRMRPDRQAAEGDGTHCRDRRRPGRVVSHGQASKPGLRGRHRAGRRGTASALSAPASVEEISRRRDAESGCCCARRPGTRRTPSTSGSARARCASIARPNGSSSRAAAASPMTFWRSPPARARGACRPPWRRSRERLHDARSRRCRRARRRHGAGPAGSGDRRRLYRARSCGRGGEEGSRRHPDRGGRTHPAAGRVSRDGRLFSGSA